MPNNHIKATHETDKSWCGKSLGNDWHFKTVDSAVLNGLHYTNVDACWGCTNAIINYLQNGTCNEPGQINELMKDIFKIQDTLKEAFPITIDQSVNKDIIT